MGLGAYPLLRGLLLAVSLLQQVPFSNAKKEPKGFAPAYGTSLRLSVPSLRWGNKSKAHQEPRPDQEPLTLALSRRERGLTALFSRGMPDWDSESNISFLTNRNRPPLPRERAGRAAFR